LFTEALVHKYIGFEINSKKIWAYERKCAQQLFAVLQGVHDQMIALGPFRALVGMFPTQEYGKGERQIRHHPTNFNFFSGSEVPEKGLF
jgi:hypothetical protein